MRILIYGAGRLSPCKMNILRLQTTANYDDLCLLLHSKVALEINLCINMPGRHQMK